VCTTMSLVHVEIAEHYSPDGFFMAIHGLLRGGSNQMKALNWWQQPSRCNCGIEQEYIKKLGYKVQSGTWCPQGPDGAKRTG
jgi:hypothetical protein